MTFLPRATMAVTLLVAIVLIAYSEAGRGGGRRGCGVIPCEIKHSNGTELYKEGCIFEEQGLYECQNRTSSRWASRGRRPGNWRDSSEEQDSLAIMYCFPKQCETDNDCPSGVACVGYMYKQCRVTWAEYQIARSCNVTTVTGAPFSARPCPFGGECDNDRRRQIEFNGQDLLVSKCRRPRRGGRGSRS